MAWLNRGWLDRGWDRPRPTAAQVRLDVVVAVIFGAVSVSSVVLYRSGFGTGREDHELEAMLWFGAAGLLLAGRRVVPLTVLLGQSVVFVVVGERIPDLAGVFTIQMTLFAGLYAAWAWSRHPRLLKATTVVVLVGMFGWLVWSLLRPEVRERYAGTTGLIPRLDAVITYSIVINIVYFLGAIAWGQAAWMSARRRAVIAEQMDRERAQQDAERRRAVQAERVRIARDLHDVVAHHVSSMGVQATGARRVLQRDPAVAARALETIESSSREAVGQMHQLVGLLREGDEPTPGRGPQPGLADLDVLADPEGTPQVEVVRVGEPVGLAPSLELNLFRIAQEAVTNARRHAAARRVTVTLRHLAGAVEVEVIDDGRGCGGHPSGSGYGLTGIRERAAVLGATLDLGDRPQGGFRVRVRAPLDPATTGANP